MEKQIKYFKKDKILLMISLSFTVICQPEEKDEVKEVINKKAINKSITKFKELQKEKVSQILRKEIYHNGSFDIKGIFVDYCIPELGAPRRKEEKNLIREKTEDACEIIKILEGDDPALQNEFLLYLKDIEENKKTENIFASESSIINKMISKHQDTINEILKEAQIKQKEEMNENLFE